MSQIINFFVNYIVPLLEGVGIALILLGAIQAVVQLIKIEVLSNFDDKVVPWVRMRVVFGQKIVLGLEFFLAGDIISTIAIPSREALIRLAGIVIIRTILSYFLTLELANYKVKKGVSSG